MSDPDAEPAPSPRRNVPWTLPTGLGVILLMEALLAVDVAARGGVIIGPQFPDRWELADPTTPLGWAGRWAAVNMTPICWVGYLLLFDGLLTWLARRRGDGGISSLRARPWRFLVAWLTSVPLWCFFDWVNFLYMDAWRYYGLPPHFEQRLMGYLIAFAAISPGMFLAAQALQHLGFRRLRGAPVRIPLAVQVGVLALGAGFTVAPFLLQDPVGSLTIWVALVFLLDPINHWLGAPSLIGDWRAGRWGRTLALMAGGLWCGLCWEFWNYWAITKWGYHLPFLGELEQIRYFEMPLPGMLGFLPFAIECWAALNLLLALLERVGLRVAEPLPDDDAVF